jgi:hypothetical protein
MSRKPPHPFPATLHPETNSVTVHFPNDWAFHGPNLEAASPEGEERMIEETRKRARLGGMSERSIEYLYGKPVNPSSRPKQRNRE